MKPALEKLIHPVPKAIGVEIGESAVRVAEVRGDRVVRYDHEPLPAGAVERGKIAQPETVIEALKALVRRNGLRRRFAVLSVPNANVYVQVVPLPNPDDAELEARRSLPQEDAVIAYKALPPVEPGSPHDLMVVATMRENLGPYLEVLQAAELQPLSAEPHFAGPLHFIEPAIAGAESAPVVYLDMGRGPAVLLIAYNGAVRHASQLNANLSELIDTITRNNAFDSFEAAEEAYIRYVTGASPSKTTAMAFDLSGDIANFIDSVLLPEISRVYETFVSHQIVAPPDAPKQVYLAGGAALAPWLAEALKNLWPNVEVAPINPFVHLQPPPKVGAPADAPRWAHVVGHALVGAHAEVEYAFDLLPPDLKRRFTPDWYRLGAAALIFLAIAAGAIKYQNMQRTIAAQELEIQTLQAKVQALQPFLKRQAELKKEKEQVLLTTKRLEALKEQQVPWVPTLGWLFATLPREGKNNYLVRISRLSAETRSRERVITLRLDINGQALDRKTLIRWMREVEKHPDFRFEFSKATKIYEDHMDFQAQLRRTKTVPAPEGEGGVQPRNTAGRSGGVNR